MPTNPTGTLKRPRTAPIARERAETEVLGKRSRGSDESESDLEDPGSKNRRRDIVDAGYDSDSSVEEGGFGLGGGRNKKGTAGDAATAAEGTAEGEAPEKPKAFLDLEDIEGQEFGDAESDDIDEYVSDAAGNDDDAPRAARKDDSMGFKLTSFNMQDELAEGRFSADGSYVENTRDPMAAHDAWLNGISQTEMREARARQARRVAERRAAQARNAKSADALTEERDTCLMGLAALLRPDETVARALARLGARKARRERARPRPYARSAAQSLAVSAQNADNDGDAAMLDADSLPPAPAPADPLERRINTITQLASVLLSVHGELEIYDTTGDDIVKTLKMEGAVRRDWAPKRDEEGEEEEEDEREEGGDSGRKKKAVISRPSVATPAPAAVAQAAAPATGTYYYKWKATAQNTPVKTPPEEYGPFTHEQMENWVKGNFFGPDGSNIDVKTSTTSEWKQWPELQNDK